MDDQRLTELDWVRIAAFGLLILYHVGMFYVPWDFHVKSPHPLPALEPWMLLSGPWRLSLLFVVSGAATALMLERGGPESGALARSRRLLLPLLFGMAVIVPPQPYLEVVQKLGYSGSYLDFLGHYFRADHGFCPEGKCIALPTWNHLWFLPYLWVYTMLLLGAQRLVGGGWATSPRWRRLGGGAALLWLPCALVAVERMLLVLPFPATHNLAWDWFNHALYGLMFVLGFVLFGRRDDAHGAWAAAVRWRWLALGLSALTLVGMPWALDWLGGWDTLPPAGHAAWLALGALRQWLPIVAVLGFARVHLRDRDGPWRRTLTEAVFPFYIVHQTVIIVTAVPLARLGWPQPLEAAAVIAITAAGCWAAYLLARSVRWLRPWFGLAPLKAAVRPAPAGARPAP